MMPLTRLLSACALAALLAACNQSAPGTASPAEGTPEEQAARQAIEAINAETARAVAAGDADALAAHYREDALMLPAGGDFIRGRQAIRKQFRKALDNGLAGLRFETLSVQVAGTLAVETGRYEATDDAGHELDHGKYLVVWQHDADGWRITRDVSTTSRLPALATPEASPLPALTPPDADAHEEPPAAES